MKKLINLFFKKKGLFKYKDYEQYKKIQIEGNIKKINNCFVDENNIKFLSHYLKKNINNPKFGICHGTRQGKEQEWFRKYLGIEVIGTEISPTATKFPNTIQWDFHDVKKEWINNVDFIYSNSFDHSYKPKECLDAWMSCINKRGILILEWTNAHIEMNKLDPFGADLNDYKKLILNKYTIKEILKAPTNRFWRFKKTYFIIICKKESENNE
jgi:hypothetical protein